MSDCTYYVYLLASFARGTLYIGVTNSLLFRVSQHRSGKGGAFTRRYKVHQLVWYELQENIEDAIQREKSLKFYPRAWKINLIERDNPRWTDLFPALDAQHGIPTIPPG
jgi:putative endonuclease